MENLFEEVHSVVASDVVLVLRVDGVVDEDIVADGILQQAERVLPNHHRIDVAVDDKQSAAQLVGLLADVVLRIAIGVLLRHIHIALAIHNLVQIPIAHWAASHASFEYVVVV